MPITTITTRFLSFIAATLLLCSSAHADTPDVVQRTHQAILKNAQLIMGFVYPTVTFNSIEECKWWEIDIGAAVSCRFAYTDMVGDHEARTLRFDLDTVGRIQTIIDAGGESIIPPFATASLTLQVLVSSIREDVKEHPDNYDAMAKAFVRALPDDPKPDIFLAWYLNLRR